MRVPPIVDELARRQHGIITARQLLDLGFDRSSIAELRRRGVLVDVYPGVFRLAGTPDTWRQSVMAAVACGMPTSYAAIRTACALHRLHGATGGVVEVVAERHRRTQRSGFRVHETLDLPAVDQWVVDGIPTVGVDRSLIDAGRYWPASRVGEMLDHAVRDGVTSYGSFEARVGAVARRGRPGISVARRVLAARGLDDGWGFEAAMQRALRAAGLPAPTREWTVQVGERRYRIDFAYPEAMLGVECDSTAWHTLPYQVERDMKRRNAITSVGVLLVHVTPTMLREECDDVMAQIRRHLIERTPSSPNMR